MNSENYGAYRKNLESNEKKFVNNFVVGHIFDVTYYENSVVYEKSEKKHIFQVVTGKDITLYKELFSGITVFPFEFNGEYPFIIDVEPLTNYVDLDDNKITKSRLLEIFNLINADTKNKVKQK